MKLVEILARELDEWPEHATMAVQDDDGQIKMAAGDEPINSNGEFWTRDVEVYHEIQHGQHNLATDHATAIVTREMWEAERAKLARGEWDGEGLPPVNTVCEHQGYDDDCSSWFPVLILAHAKIGDRHVAVFQRVDDDMHITFSDAEFFRPIRTPEKIAAQEREEAVQQMLSVAEGMEAGLYMICCALYDAGYRKQEEV